MVFLVLTPEQNLKFYQQIVFWGKEKVKFFVGNKRVVNSFGFTSLFERARRPVALP